MRIDTIKVRNFRGFGLFERNFHPEINVIVGENGTGKTALLDALAVGVGSFFLGVDGVSARGIEHDDTHLLAGESDDVFTSSPKYPVVLNFGGQVFGRPSSWFRSLRGRGRKTTIVGTNHLRGRIEIELKRRRASGESRLPLIAYHGTGRLWVQKRSRAAARSTRTRTRFDAYENCLEAASDEKSFLDWFKAMEWTAFQEGAEPVALRVVRNTLRETIPGCTDLRYRSKEGELVAIFDDGRRLPTRMLSDGFRTMLGLVCDLAWRCATLNPELGEIAAKETPGVVLIDEIDLHLHPNWQKRVVDDLRRCFPCVQFFMTTHSPFIVQSLRAGEVVALSGPGHLDTPPFKRGVEEIAKDVLGVADVARSERFREMEAAARGFLAALEGADGHGTAAVDETKRQYLKLVARYADDPAFLATLKVEGALRGVRLDDPKRETTP